MYLQITAIAVEGSRHKESIGPFGYILLLSSCIFSFASLLFDSGGGGGSLEEHAKLIAETVFRSTFLGTVADGPRQRNSCDCGMVRRVESRRSFR